MKWHRINALLMRHIYLYKRSMPRIMDIFYWPIMELLLWGFLSMYLEKTSLAGFNAVTVLLGALILWDLLSQAHRTVSIAFLEEIWERNLLNIFVTPLKVSEFLVSTILLGFVRILLVTGVMAGIAALFYSFNLFTFGVYLLPFIANLLLFGWILGLFTICIILRYGTSAQVLAFGFLLLLQPFTAVFYPVTALPEVIQPFAYLFPSTYIFEGMRAVIATGTLPITTLIWATFFNIIYLLLIVWLFLRMLARVKQRGALMRLND